MTSIWEEDDEDDELPLCGTTTNDASAAGERRITR